MVRHRKKLGMDESTLTSHLSGHIMWQDRLNKEYVARTRWVSAMYKHVGKSPPVEPDLRKEASGQRSRILAHGPNCAPRCCCGMDQTADLEFGPLGAHAGQSTSLPGVLASSAHVTVPRRCLSRWYTSEGPGGRHCGHGASAAMEQTSGTAWGSVAAQMVGESDYQMMTRSVARPRELGGRRTRACLEVGAVSAPNLTIQMSPALMPCWRERRDDGNLHSFQIREYLNGGGAGDVEPKFSLPLRDHEIASRMSRGVHV